MPSFFEIAILSFLLFILRPLLDSKTKLNVLTTSVFHALCSGDFTSSFVQGIICSSVSFAVFRWSIPVIHLLPKRKGYQDIWTILLVLTTTTALIIPLWEEQSDILLSILACLVLNYFNWDYLMNRSKLVILSISVSWILISSSSLSATVCVLTFCSMERTISTIDTWPHLYPGGITLFNVVKAMFFMKKGDLPLEDVHDFLIVCDLFKNKTKSFLMATNFFPYGVRWDVLILYAFGYVTDELVDDDSISEKARKDNVSLIRRFLDDIFQDRVKDHSFLYGTWHSEEKSKDSIASSSCTLVDWSFYEKRLSKVDLAVFKSLYRISHYLPPQGLYDLVEGFEWDVEGKVMKDENELLRYTHCVAGSIGILLCHIFPRKGYLHPIPLERGHQDLFLHASERGKVLQMINIARDIVTDSLIGRVYLPLSWLSQDDFVTLKEKREPWSLGEERLKAYALKALDYAEKVDNENKFAVGLGLTRFHPPQVLRVASLAEDLYKGIGRTIRSSKGYFKRAKNTQSKFELILKLLKYLYLPLMDKGGDWLF